MIEIIYKDENAKDKSGDKIKIPKNIRQIGKCNSKKKIYIEDQVMAILKSNPQQDSIQRYGILLGEVKNNSGCMYIYINGVVQAESNPLNEVRFNDTVWSQLYDSINKYYNKKEIIGWYLSVPYKAKDDITIMTKTHLDNFVSGDKACFFIDRTESEEGFYFYENNYMEKQTGYYIYFDKNPEVDKYISENPIEKEIVKEKVRTGEGSFRAIIKEKQKNVQTGYGPKMARAGAMVAVAATLVTAFTAYNNYSDIKDLNGSFNKLTSAVLNQNEGGDSGKDTVVEVVGSEISPTKPDETKETEKNTEKTTKKEQPSTEAPTKKEPATEGTTKPVSKDVNYYTVKDGETLFGICMKVYSDVNALPKLQKANGLKEGDTIYEGQKIILP